jgi:CxxC-x17-CxxC domain-containing protein
MRDFRPGRSRGRDDRKSFGGGEKREMFPAVCDNCGKDCMVPFKPTSGKPIFCSDCFEKEQGGSDRRESRGGDRDYRGGRDDRRSFGGDRGGNSNVQDQLDRINAKLDKILRAIEGY